MNRLKVVYDSLGKTLTVYLDDPEREAICEETEDDLTLIWDDEGRIIGLERLNIELETTDGHCDFETSVLCRGSECHSVAHPDPDRRLVSRAPKSGSTRYTGLHRQTGRTIGLSANLRGFQ